MNVSRTFRRTSVIAVGLTLGLVAQVSQAKLAANGNWANGVRYNGSTYQGTSFNGRDENGASVQEKSLHDRIVDESRQQDPAIADANVARTGPVAVTLPSGERIELR